MNNTPKMRAKSSQRPAPANGSNDHGFDIGTIIDDWTKPTKIMGLDNRAPLTSTTKSTKTAKAGLGATSPATSPNYENQPPAQRGPANYGSAVPHGAGTNVSGAVHRINTSADPRLQRQQAAINGTTQQGGPPSTSAAAQQRPPSTKAKEWRKYGPPPAPSTSVQHQAVASPTLSMSPDNESNASVPTTPANPDDHSTCARSLMQLQGRVKRREERIAKLEEENGERQKKEVELRQRLANNEKYFVSQTGKLEKENAALLLDKQSAQKAAEAQAKEHQKARDKLEDENMELQVAKDSAEQQAASLQHRLDAITKAADGLQQEKNDLIAQCESLERSNAQLTTDGEVLREQVQNITKLQDQASKRADELQKKVDDLTQKAADAEEAAQLAVTNMMQTRTEMDEHSKKISELNDQMAAQGIQLRLATDGKQLAEKRNESLILQLAEMARRLKDRMCVKCTESEQHNEQLKAENGSLQKALAEERRSNAILREQFKTLPCEEPSTSGAALSPFAVAPTSASAPRNADGIQPTKKRAVAGANDAAPVAAMASGTSGTTQPEPPRKRIQVKEEAIQAQKSNAVAEAPTSSEHQSDEREVVCSRHVSKKNRRSNDAVPRPKAEVLESSEGDERSSSNTTTVSDPRVEASPEQGPATSCGAGSVTPVECAHSAAQSRSETAHPVTPHQHPQAFLNTRECLQPSVDLNPLMPWPQQQLAPYFAQQAAQLPAASNMQLPYNPMFHPQFHGSMASSTAVPGMMAPSVGARMGAVPQMPHATFGGYTNYVAADWTATQAHHTQHQPAAQQYRPQYPQPTMGIPQQQQTTQTPAFFQQQQMGTLVGQQHQPHATTDALSPQQQEQMRQIDDLLQQLSPQQFVMATAARHLQHEVVNDVTPPQPNAQRRQ